MFLTLQLMDSAVVIYIICKRDGLFELILYYLHNYSFMSFIYYRLLLLHESRQYLCFLHDNLVDCGIIQEERHTVASHCMVTAA